MKIKPTVEKWDTLREKLADIEHQRWSDWQRYVHSKCVNHSNGKGEWVCFPSELFRQWERQINTPYSELSEKEKDSDREQVDRYLPILSHSLQEAKAEERERIENLVTDYEDVLVERLKQDPMSKGRERYFAEEIVGNIDGFFEWLPTPEKSLEVNKGGIE